MLNITSDTFHELYDFIFDEKNIEFYQPNESYLSLANLNFHRSEMPQRMTYDTLLNIFNFEDIIKENENKLRKLIADVSITLKTNRIERQNLLEKEKVRQAKLYSDARFFFIDIVLPAIQEHHSVLLRYYNSIWKDDFGISKYDFFVKKVLYFFHQLIE